MYKLTRPDGFDFYSGTINYRDAIGGMVKVIDYDPSQKGVCGRGLHASRDPNNCFQGAKIPCSAFRVKGIQKITGDETKSRYRALKIIEEIEGLDSLFGWNYTEAVCPIHPFKITPPKISDKEILLLKQWASVWDSVWDSVWASVWDSVWGYVSSFFLLEAWKGVKHEKGENPFQSCIDLWEAGIVPSFDGKIWRLHAGKNAKIVWEGEI